jgi:thiol:disulfide interchange protein DsbA
MHMHRRLFCTAALLTLSGVVAAAPVAPKEGVHYQVLPQKLETPAGKPVEVIEFFAYYCPHCNVFEPLLADWVKKQGNNIVFKRVHVSGGARVLPQQRLFYALDALGLVGQYHAKAFAAMHQQGVRFADDAEVIDWAAKAGIDRARFTDAYNSFGVQAKARRAAAMMNEYRVDHWPMVAIDGRFMTSPSMANPEGSEARTEVEQQQVALQVMDALVARAKADKSADKK